MTLGKSLSNFVLAGILLLLAFAIPAVRWLVEVQFPAAAAIPLLANLLLAAFCLAWNGYSKAFSVLPASKRWRLLVLLVSGAALLFLLLDLQQRPISAISGQARSSYEILDVILAGSLLEELLFRGVIWHLVEQRYKHHAQLNLPLLAITSILFGIMHVGYWLPSGLPLPAQAYTHVLSMVFAGLLFGLLRLNSRSLAAPVAVHMLANAVILFFQ